MTTTPMDIPPIPREVIKEIEEQIQVIVEKLTSIAVAIGERTERNGKSTGVSTRGDAILDAAVEVRPTLGRRKGSNQTRAEWFDVESERSLRADSIVSSERSLRADSIFSSERSLSADSMFE